MICKNCENQFALVIFYISDSLLKVTTSFTLSEQENCFVLCLGNSTTELRRVCLSDVGNLKVLDVLD